MKKQLALAILGVLGTVVALTIVFTGRGNAARAAAPEQCKHYVVDDTFDLVWSDYKWSEDGWYATWDLFPTEESEVTISVESPKNALVDVDFLVVTSSGDKVEEDPNSKDEFVRELANINAQLSMKAVRKGQRSYSPLPVFSSPHHYRVIVSLVGKGDTSLLERLSSLKFPVKVKIFLSPADVDERIRRACCLEQNRGKE